LSLLSRAVEHDRQINPCEFVAAIKPALQRRDAQAICGTVRQRWSAEQVVSLLGCDDCDARKVAALALSLAGCKGCIEPLGKALRDSDKMVAEMAEHAMWSIWSRGGSPEANHQLKRGVDAMERNDIPHAITHFDRAISFSPDFAEAYNQRALARFILEQFEQSLSDCRKTVELEPLHFGAWAGMGHCYAHLGNCEKALASYRRAVEINPHMHHIREALSAGCSDG
jgi:tetratricopeptide (TPR) repeat protein